MASGEAEADDLSRLEAALDRIAAYAQRPQPVVPDTPTVDTAAVAARLDRLIVQLQDALVETVAGEPAMDEA